MQFYLAPMEGITTYIFRNAYAHYYGEIDKIAQFCLLSVILASNERGMREYISVKIQHDVKKDARTIYLHMSRKL